MNTSIKTYIKKMLWISFPIILSQIFLNLASLLDTLMVGQLDDITISGVYVATQILFVVNLMIFGAIEGCSVFFCQYYGKNDEENMQKMYKLKFIFCLIISLIITILLSIFKKPLISFYVKTPQEIKVATSYINILIFSIIPYAITCCISTTLREYHHSLPPMFFSLLGTIINCLINYLLIFGKFGFPKLEGVGAAIGTITQRVLEMFLLILYVKKKKYSFSKNFFNKLSLEKSQLKKIILKSIPLFINETCWALSQTVLVLIFTKVDSIATSVLPIVQTIFNLLFVFLLGLGNGITILVGNSIGANDFKKAQKEAYISLIVTLFIGIFLGILLFTLAGVITSFYKGINIDARNLATYFIKFNSFYLLINGMNTCLFFLLRAGGRTEIVFIFDSFYCWIISIPFALLLYKNTTLSLKEFYPIVYLIDIIKTIVGLSLLFFKKWYKNLTINQEKNSTKKQIIDN